MGILSTFNCTVNPSPIQHEIIIGENLVPKAIDFAKTIANQYLIVTTDAVDALLPLSVGEKLVLPSSESIKSRAIKEKIENTLIEKGFDRKSCLVAIGGGALLDVVGFVAATYCRGISYVSVPTTLLAMTDASIGGKTAVNVKEAKNWIGAFHFPKMVFIDLDFLQTLPQKEYLYGLSETLKHSLIADSKLFNLLESQSSKILKREKSLIFELVSQSSLIKKAVIERDPYETLGYRKILNFGHTVGHGLETCSDYSYSHGQAVILGMRIEAELCFQLGYLSSSALKRICKMIELYPFEMNFPKALPFEQLKRDKKGAFCIVVLAGIGKTAPFNGEYALPISNQQFNKAWDDVVCHAQTR